MPLFGGRGQIVGTNTNDAAAAGNVGEIISSSVESGSAVSLVTATAKTITSIALTPGDWDLQGVVHYDFGATTNVAGVISSISGTTDTYDLTADRCNSDPRSSTPSNLVPLSCPITRRRVSIAVNTTYYLVAWSNFGTSTCTAHGHISARRVR